MKRLVLLGYFSFLCIYGNAQLSTSKFIAGPVKQSVLTDSVKSKVTSAGRQIRKLNLSTDTLTMSDYVSSIERVNDNLNSVGDSAKMGFEVVRMSRRIREMTEDIRQIRQNTRGRHSVFNVKNQYLYQSFTSKLEDETDQIQEKIDKLYRRIYHARKHLKVVLADSIFRKLYTNKELHTTFDDRLVHLEWKWNRTDSLTKANADSLNALKVRLSDNSFDLSNMLNMMDNRLDKAGQKLFGPEVSYLWEKVDPKLTLNLQSKNSVSTFASEQKATGYYFSQTSGVRSLLIILGVLLFIWLYFKRKLLKNIRNEKEIYKHLSLNYLSNYPVLSILILVMSLMPFFDAYAPTSYISAIFLLSVLAASLIFVQKIDKSSLANWFGLTIFLLADILAFLFFEPAFQERLLLILIHSGIIYFMVRFMRTLGKHTPYFTYLKTATITGIILISAGIIYNLFGRYSLSGILGMAGIFAVVQAILLTIFIEIVTEIVLLQYQSNRLNRGNEKPFDSSPIANKIKMPLVLVSVILWGIMLTSHLNIYHKISQKIADMLIAPREFGSISFQLQNMLLFFAIIWLAHSLQRLLSYFFGGKGDENDDITNETKGHHSRILITRLLVLIGGYLLAITASGLPIDKLTFLLGALGVGVGMGLQHIVNNIVSGIILIFDGSLQIGDEIEVSGQAGKVKEIGLRASTLNTPDGAEVIIPNGNILSQNIVNWTYHSNEKRVVITISLSAPELDANVVNQVINDTIKDIPHVITKRIPVILYRKVTPESCIITIRFWGVISKADSIKSDAMQRLSAAFTAKKITFN